MTKLGLSILNSNFLKLHDELSHIVQYVDFLHIDVMDNHFVPDFTFGSKFIRELQEECNLLLDCHLMIDKAESFIDRLNGVKCSISFHIETTHFPFMLIEKIRKNNQQVGIAINPYTELPPMSILEEVDRLLIMSVEPGKGGQNFLAKNTLDKLKKAESLNIPVGIQLDGGINLESIKVIKDFDISELVVGSTVFRHNDTVSRITAITEIRDALER
jgi:ribulose-phosphate 3-epimerase